LFAVVTGDKVAARFETHADAETAARAVGGSVAWIWPPLPMAPAMKRTPSLKTLVAATRTALGVDRDQLMATSSRGPVGRALRTARTAFIHVAHHYCEVSYDRLAECLSLNRSTIIEACHAAKREIATNATLADNVDRLKTELRL
jgi:hypothetical protein